MKKLAVTPFPDSRASSPPLEVTEDYLHDESKVSAASALALYRPSSIAELRSTLAELVDRLVPITISGARTGVTAGSVPEPDSVVLSTDRLKSILSLDRTSNRVEVEAGVTLRELQEYLDEHAPDLFLPVDPTELSASFGGLIANNAGGARSFRFGSIRNWVYSLQVELTSKQTLYLTRGDHAGADSIELQPVQSLGNSVSLPLEVIRKPPGKSSVGYGFSADRDPIDLFIGAEGTLGVVSTIGLQLALKPRARVFLLQFVQSAEQAFAIVRSIRDQRSPSLFAVEYLDRRALELARRKAPEARLSKGSAGSEGALIFEFGFSSEDEAESEIVRVSEVFVLHGADTTRSLAGFEEKDLLEIKAFRHSVPESVNATIAERKRTYPSLHKLATDVVAQDRDLAWVFDLYQTTLDQAGLEYTIFGHIGDNHFHVNILPRDHEELVRAKELYGQFAHKVAAKGGAVSGEHGLGKLKKHFLQIQYSEEEIEQFRRIRLFFDPLGLLNPGVLFDP